MTTAEPPDVVTEKAVLQLLHLAFLEIRFHTAPVDDESLETLLKRRDQARIDAAGPPWAASCIAGTRA
ncbi:hypothetical protein [Micromonospora sp. NPDC023644]|uniref:hypothetical protein n=1 Tax=Micromonospora sp. NPDC023644 TaxID=3154321 RepID=UPI0033CF7913